jgi:hypothetical protein
VDDEMANRSAKATPAMRNQHTNTAVKYFILFIAHIHCFDHNFLGQSAP